MSIKVDTAQIINEKLLSEVSIIVKGLMPDITADAQAGIEDALKRQFSSGIEAEKKTGTKAVESILSAQTKALEALRKELKEAQDEVASSQKSATTAFTDAMADWTTAMKLDPKLAMGLKMLPDIVGQFQAVIDAGNKLKANKHDITVNALSLIGALLSMAISVMWLTVLTMQVFGG